MRLMNVIGRGGEIIIVVSPQVMNCIMERDREMKCRDIAWFVVRGGRSVKVCHLTYNGWRSKEKRFSISGPLPPSFGSFYFC